MKTIMFLSSLILLALPSVSQNNIAEQFLNTLNSEQKKKTLLAFDNPSKSDWHYLPAASYPRAGISLEELNNEQEELLFKLLRSSLSETGYSKTKQIISLEEVLAELSGNTRYRDPEQYYVAFYGHPEKDGLWAWAFQGHHLSLNFTVSEGKMSVAPRFMGANPATIKTGKRKGERTLAKEEDLGLQLINALPESQKEKAIFSERAPYDITTGTAPEVDPLKPVGIKLQEMSAANQQLLLQLIDEYLATMPDELAEERMKKLEKEETDDIRFGWAGATEPGRGHYYRIQGKSFLVEFDNTQNSANHIHSVWRDFDGDFGHDLIREHYQSSSHHHH
jgi:hypothetical protein